MTRLVVVLGVCVAGLAGCASGSSQKKDDAPAGAPADTRRCEAIFDAIRPSLEKQWETTLPLDLFQKARSNLGDLKTQFSRECAVTFKPNDLACAEGDNSADLKECAAQPADKRAACEQDAEQTLRNPLYCKGVSTLLDRVGAAWMKAHDI